MPGLIEAHCHITFDEPSSNDELFFHRREGLAAIVAARNAQKLLRAGVTAFLDPDAIFDVGIDLRDAIEAGVVAAPRMATGGNALLTSVGGTAGLLIPNEGLRGYARVVNTRDEIVSEVRQQIKRGVDWIKVHVTGIVPRQRTAGEIQAWTLDELRLVCDTAHDLGIPVMGHCRNASSTRDAARAGFDMILHATHMDEAALEAVVKHNVPLVPTLTFQANLADFGALVGADEDLRHVFRKEIEDSSVMLKRAYDAGVPLLCGTESGFSLTPYGEWHYRELQVFVERIGLTTLQAIRCATLEGAKAMRMEGRIGSIAPDFLADVIVVSGDVANDVSLLGDKSRIRHVLVGGIEQDLTPIPPHDKLEGWRIGQYSNRILYRDEQRNGGSR
ncbi:MAG: amidohydrolase family protein [Gammaproteobacteria bacterium]|nr:amidohydrolase family protein [Gammaproteobacteria bacterium]